MTKVLALTVALLACVPAAAEEPRRSAAIFLVAAKSLQDPNFRETVVLVTQHGGRGPIGVIVNRPTPTPVSTLFPENRRLESTEGRLHFGGPVARQTLVYLFRVATPPKDAIELLDGVYMSLKPDLLRELLQRDTPFRDLRVFAGYSGWAPGQLEHEIARGDWLLAEADAATLFDRDPDGIWQEFHRRASSRRIRSEQLSPDSQAVALAGPGSGSEFPISTSVQPPSGPAGPSD